MYSVTDKTSAALLKKMLDKSTQKNEEQQSLFPEDISLVPMTENDAEQATILSNLVGWSHSEEDWKHVIRLAEEHAFSLQHNGTMIGTGVSIYYGNSRGRISEIIIHPNYQRKGYGKKMVHTLLNSLLNKGVEQIDLDSCTHGTPFYEKMGFRQLYTVETWTGGDTNTGKHYPFPQYTNNDIADIVALDYKVFGAQRTKMFNDIISHHNTTIWIDRDGAKKLQGFLSAYTIGNTLRIGPWIHRTFDGARKLLETCMHTKGSSTARVDVPVTNDHSRDILQYHGFTKTNDHTRMLFAPRHSVQEKTKIYYGIASLGAG